MLLNQLNKKNNGVGFPCPIIFLFVISVFLMISCNCIKENAFPTPNLVLNESYSGKEFELKEGEIFQIQLKGNPTTGYWWYFEDFDSLHFELISEKITEDSRLLGAPVTGIWEIKAKSTGSAIIKMKYYRDWEGSSKAIDEFVVKINIK